MNAHGNEGGRQEHTVKYLCHVLAMSSHYLKGVLSSFLPWHFTLCGFLKFWSEIHPSPRPPAVLTLLSSHSPCQNWVHVFVPTHSGHLINITWWFIHLFSNYVLSTYCVPGFILGAWNTSVNKTEKILYLPDDERLQICVSTRSVVLKNLAPKSLNMFFQNH